MLSRAGAERLGAPPVVAALDIGGTKLAAAIVDADGQVLARSQTPTQTGTNQGRADEELFQRLTALLDSVIQASPKPPQVIGVGCGGPM
ncbi:MAG: ROK family protein, partial [Betaproteobacteria bacterium]|nr:ROK family protein [Betaproteobacteria bacterium]